MMEKYFRYTEDTSDKYWEVTFEGNSVQTFFGKVGSAGRVEEKTYSSSDECLKEVEKLIKSKLKKGYQEVAESSRVVKDASTLIEIRDFEDEWGIKANPISKKMMNESFFWSCIEETSPFGNDEGNDTFAFYYESQLENPRLKPLDFLEERFSDTSFYPLQDLMLTDSSDIQAKVKDTFFDNVIIQDNAIWATAFGQLVLKGKVDEKIKAFALAALERQKLPMFLELHGDENRVMHIEKMEAVLKSL
jgi:uncharacterized protein YfeS